MQSIIVTLLIIAGFYLLIKGADFLVRGASSLARRFGISSIVIGLTLVAFGTSLPETFVNIFASINSQNDIVFGNIIGSNILNLLFILGISGLIRPMFINKNTLFREIPYSLLAAALLLILANDSFIFNSSENMLSYFDGFLFITLFIIFLIYAYRMSGNKSKKDIEVSALSLPRAYFYIFAGFFALFIGARLVVDNAVIIAALLGVSEKFIALTIISAGTSLPELATSAVAAYRKEYDISIGNIVGSNIFNIFFILGMSALIRPAKYAAVLNADIIVLIMATLFLIGSVYFRKDRKLHRIESFLFLASYCAYVAYLFYRG